MSPLACLCWHHTSPNGWMHPCFHTRCCRPTFSSLAPNVESKALQAALIPCRGERHETPAHLRAVYKGISSHWYLPSTQRLPSTFEGALISPLRSALPASVFVTGLGTLHHSLTTSRCLPHGDAKKCARLHFLPLFDSWVRQPGLNFRTCCRDNLPPHTAQAPREKDIPTSPGAECSERIPGTSEAMSRNGKLKKPRKVPHGLSISTSSNVIMRLSSHVGWCGPNFF